MAPYSSARPGKPWFVTIHTGEGILNRNDMAAFLDNNSGASAHAASDAGGVAAPLVPYDRAAWTAGGTANSWGLHIELCAFAHMTREQWLSEHDITLWVPWVNGNRTVRSPMTMLRHTAAWVRDRCAQYGITVRKVGAADLRADVDGICGHADTTAAWRETDHTDPGPNFPWDVFINLVAGQESAKGDDMLKDESIRLWDGTWVLASQALASAQGMAKDAREASMANAVALASIQAQVAGIATDGDVTPERLAELTREAASSAAAEQVPAIVAGLEEGIKGLVEEALGRVRDTDNLDEAKRTVDELLERIGTLVPPVKQQNVQ